MINELKKPHVDNRAIPPVGIINFIHEGKNISFNPIELSKFSDDIREAFSESLVQCATVGYWWSVMQRRHKDASRELDAYRGQLYHTFKADGQYGERYHGLRPTESGLDHAMATDKTYLEESASLDRLREIVDQLYYLYRLLDKKHDVLKSLSIMLNTNQRADLLEEQYRRESDRSFPGPTAPPLKRGTG